MKLLLALAATGGLLTVSLAHAAVDGDKAQALMKSSGCMACHAVDKTKVGPSFKDVAKKWKGKADAQDHLVKHITLKPMITVDGEKKEHKALKTTDAAEVTNAVQWILAQ